MVSKKMIDETALTKNWRNEFRWLVKTQTVGEFRSDEVISVVITHCQN